MNKWKKLLIISDIHSGHGVGGTPSKWQKQGVLDRAYIARKKIYDWYKRTLRKMGDIDICIVNGDCIEGDGSRNGGIELIERDRNVQAKMALQTILETRAKEYRMTFGTDYHTGKQENFEQQIADKLGCPIESHGFYDVNGLVFDVRHHIGGSSVPYGKHTAINKSIVLNSIDKEWGMAPKSNVIVRSHLHFYAQSTGPLPNTYGFVTPALQGAGSNFGARICEGVVNIGMIEFNIKNKKEWGWKTHLMDLSFQAASVEQL